MSKSDPFAGAKAVRKPARSDDASSADVTFPVYEDWQPGDLATPSDAVVVPETREADLHPVLETPADAVPAQEIVDVVPEHQVEVPADAVVHEGLEGQGGYDPDAVVEAASQPAMTPETRDGVSGEVVVEASGTVGQAEAPSGTDSTSEAAEDASTTAEEGDEGFDPAEHTVDEVNKYLREADKAEVKRLRKLEKRGKDRSSIAWPE